ncbi:hypothetical protein J2847_001945 [Azospirillum agricola]|nr:hypothetical protein [Azospirillum agricola]
MSAGCRDRPSAGAVGSWKARMKPDADMGR